MLLYELQAEENLVTVSDGSTDETDPDEMEEDPFGILDDVLGSDISVTSEFLEELFENVEEEKKSPSKPRISMLKPIYPYPEPVLFICDICGAKLINKTTLKTHMLRHIPKTDEIICDICPNKKTFTTIFNLRRHKSYYHADDPKKYFRTCDECNRSFKNQNLLNCHKRYDHTIKRRLECEKCRKLFKNKITLKNHVKKLHGPEILQYECDFCKKTFLRKDALLEHRTIHTGERPYKCLWCPKTFRNSSHFSTHRTTVHTVEYLKWKQERFK